MAGVFFMNMMSEVGTLSVYNTATNAVTKVSGIVAFEQLRDGICYHVYKSGNPFYLCKKADGKYYTGATMGNGALFEVSEKVAMWWIARKSDTLHDPFWNDYDKAHYDGTGYISDE